MAQTTAAHVGCRVDEDAARSYSARPWRRSKDKLFSAAVPSRRGRALSRDRPSCRRM